MHGHMRIHMSKGLHLDSQASACNALFTTAVPLQRMQVSPGLLNRNCYSDQLETWPYTWKPLIPASFVRSLVSHHYLLLSSPALLLKSILLSLNMFFWTLCFILIHIIWRYVLTHLASQSQEIFCSNDTRGVPSSFHTLVPKWRRGARRKLGNRCMIKWPKELIYE